MIRDPNAIRSEPVWTPARRLKNGTLPSGLAPWLLDGSSLTRRLREACGGALTVRILRQGWYVPMLCERRVLALPQRRVALLREVLLVCEGTPWVFARTVIPRNTLRGRYRRLADLGNRPLGEVLFADPGVRRGELEVARVDGVPLGVRGTVWGRRSLFHAGGRPLLVSEFFVGPVPDRAGGQR